jgi:hypothetical protein
MADVMPFGKHKGAAVSDVPLGYLLWCSREIRRCPMVVIQEIERRVGASALSGRSSDRLRAIRENGGLTVMGTFVGCDFSRLREAFDRAGGNSNDCPFDAHDYRYAGPEIPRP